MNLFVNMLIVSILAFFPTGLVISKLIAKDKDIRTLGSGNIGGTNIWRVFGPFWGLITMLIDAGKSAFIVYFVPTWSTFFLLGQNQKFSIAIILGIILVVINIFNPLLRCKGGKGVATGIGVLFGLDYQIAVIALVAFLLMAGVHKFRGKDIFKASITGTVGALAGALALAKPTAEIILLVCVVPMIIFAHRKNISDFIKKPPL